MIPAARVSRGAGRAKQRRTNAAAEHERPNYPHPQIVQDHYEVLNPKDRISHGHTAS